MKKIIFILLIFTGFIACKNPNQEEIGKVEDLVTMVNEMEQTMLTVDTARVFLTKREMEKDFNFIESLQDTFDRETAFKLDEFYGGKKTVFRFSTNYFKILKDIKYAKKQLITLKTDLENGLITKENFEKYYATEHASLMELNMLINKSTAGIEEIVQTYHLNRESIDELLNLMAKKATENEE